MRPITVIGGANVDLCGAPDAPVAPRDSNPGRVSVRAGGVGRNIAESLARLGLPVRLICALGEDRDGAFLLDECQKQGIDMSLTLYPPNGVTSCYLCINDFSGDLLAAVNDMKICDALTPRALEAALPRIDESSLCVLDANLPEETIAFLARRVRVPLAADPVSAIKAPRLRPALEGMWAIKPNLPEAEALTGLSAREAGVEGVAQGLWDLGVQRVFLSLGESGAYYLDERGRGALPRLPGPVLDTTGCGDAFLAAALEATLRGMDAARAAERALAAAALRAAGRAATLSAIEQATKEGSAI